MPYPATKPRKKVKKPLKKKRSGVIVPKKTKPPMKRKSPYGRRK
tara:strand:- start:2043 stop:2174 length:132 start_codon:yes stop_codon:yes gene_type:complete